MSVFKALRDRRSAYAGKKLPTDLTRGLKYICYDFNQRRSDFIDKAKQTHPMTLVAYIKDPATGNKYYVTCPALYNDLTEVQLQELKDAIVKGKPPFIVYYGRDGNRNELILHEHDESKFQNLPHHKNYSYVNR